MSEAGRVLSLGIMYLIQTMINIIIPSGSAKAALTMPIMAPFSDVIGLSRQATVMAFQFGDGFTNMITPTPGVLIVLEALELGEYGKVYLSLGVNELGYYNDEGFYQAYCDAIDAIRACQPDAVIYIQGLIPLNESVVAASGGPSYLTNEHLRVYNGLMQKAAEEKQVVFLDLYSEFANENGELPEEASKDGVHLKSDYCKQWLEYLKVHTVDFETLYPEGTET